MTTLTKEDRAALQSVRAKARKAAAVSGVDLPKAITAHLDAVIAYVDGKLKAKVTPIPITDAGPAKPAKTTGKGTSKKAAKAAAVAA